MNLSAICDGVRLPSGRYQRYEAPGIMGGEAPAPTQSDPTNKDRRIQHWLFHLPAPRVR